MTREALNFNTQTKTAEQYMKQKNYKNALNAYLSSMFQNKNNPAAYIGVSKAYKGLGEYEKAIKHLNNAKKIKTQTAGCKRVDFDIYYELGINYLLNAEPCKALGCFHKAIKLNPKNLNAQIQLAITHELLEEPEIALMIYDKILEEKPDFILCYNHKAGLYMQMDEFEEAARVFKQILKINPNYFRANLGLGICFDKLERKHFAIRYYKKYIAKKPNSDTTKALVGRIVEIYSKKQGTKRRLQIVS